MDHEGPKCNPRRFGISRMTVRNSQSNSPKFVYKIHIPLVKIESCATEASANAKRFKIRRCNYISQQEVRSTEISLNSRTHIKRLNTQTLSNKMLRQSPARILRINSITEVNSKFSKRTSSILNPSNKHTLEFTLPGKYRNISNRLNRILS